MKNYTITVNGTAYDVAVEEKGNTPGVMPVATVATPIAPQKPVAAKGEKGSIVITAGAAGKVLKIDVKVGDAVKVHDQVAVLEVMKMETPVVTSDVGVVASIDVVEGQSIEAGETLLTLN